MAVKRVLLPRSRVSFYQHLDPKARVLDVGCGNDSPYHTKAVMPECHYTGIDIGDYNQTKPNPADRYILTTPEQFTQEIRNLASSFDAVISSHNIEHCNDRIGTLTAMVHALKVGGLLFMTFPSQRSTTLPSRGGTLNYHDDPSHVGEPPDVDEFLRVIRESGGEALFAAKCYAPLANRVRGWINEPRSRRINRCLSGTWALYGFEAMIWARRVA